MINRTEDGYNLMVRVANCEFENTGSNPVICELSIETRNPSKMQEEISKSGM